MADVGFRRVKTASARRVLRVRAQHSQKRVAGGAGDLQIAAFVHVPVVVNPFTGDASPMQTQRRAPIVRRGGLGALLQLELIQKFARAKVRGLQRFHHRRDAFVAQALQLFGASPVRLRVGLAREFFNKVAGQLRNIGQLRPRQLQRRSELPQEMAHSAAAAAESECQESPHERPSDSASESHRVVNLLRRRNVVARQPQRLAPQRLHQAVGDEAVYFLSHQQRAHSAFAVKGLRRGDCLRRGFFAAANLHQRQKINRIKRMPDAQALRMLHSRLQAAGQKSGGGGGQNGLRGQGGVGLF